MSESKKLNKGLVILNGLLIVVFFAVNIRMLIIPNIPSPYQISSLVTVFALAAAFNYFISKYDKSSAKYYKAFVALIMFSSFVSLVGVGTKSNNVIQLTIVALQFSFTVIMFAGKDLGKKVSFAICFAFIAVCVFEIAYRMFFAQNVLFEELALESSVNMVLMWGKLLSQLLSAVLLTVMTYGKYLDKEERGTN